jgi:hypothetical protein
MATNATNPKKFTNPSLFMTPGTPVLTGKQLSHNDLNPPVYG